MLRLIHSFSGHFQILICSSIVQALHCPLQTKYNVSSCFNSQILCAQVLPPFPIMVIQNPYCHSSPRIETSLFTFAFFFNSSYLTPGKMEATYLTRIALRPLFLGIIKESFRIFNSFTEFLPTLG